MDINNFYYQLLNIGKNIEEMKLLKQVNIIIDEEMRKISNYTNDIEGMCKVASYNIYDRLKQFEYQVNLFNTKDLLDIKEHIAIILSYLQDEEMQYLLIDPTYNQFVKKDNCSLNPYYQLWPSDILEKTDNDLLNNLIRNKYAKVTNESFNNYLYSFIGKDIVRTRKIDFKEIIINERKIL